MYLNSEGNLDVTPEVLQSWHHNGYIVVKRRANGAWRDWLGRRVPSQEGEGGEQSKRLP